MTKSSFPGLFFQKMDGICASPISYTKRIKKALSKGNGARGPAHVLVPKNTFTDVFAITGVPVTLATSESSFSALRRDLPKKHHEVQDCLNKLEQLRTDSL